MKPASPPRVSVVDDDPIIASTLSLILRLRGFDATAFFDAASALEAAPEHGPDLVISDVGMPTMNGIELAFRLRQKYPNCKIVLISGAGETAKLVDVHRKQGEHFIVFPKPVRLAELLQYVCAITSL